MICALFALASMEKTQMITLKQMPFIGDHDRTAKIVHHKIDDDVAPAAHKFSFIIRGQI